MTASRMRCGGHFKRVVIGMKPVANGRGDIRHRSTAKAALPDNGDTPSGGPQGSNVPCIAFDVVVKLRLPECRVGGGRGGQAAIGMAMPEAAVHEHNGAKPGENEIGPPRQFSGVQTIAQPCSVKRGA